MEKYCLNTVGWYTFIPGYFPYSLSSVTCIPSLLPIGEEINRFTILFPSLYKRLLRRKLTTSNNISSSDCNLVLSSTKLQEDYSYTLLVMVNQQ